MLPKKAVGYGTGSSSSSVAAPHALHCRCPECFRRIAGELLARAAVLRRRAAARSAHERLEAPPNAPGGAAVASEAFQRHLVDTQVLLRLWASCCRPSASVPELGIVPWWESSCNFDSQSEDQSVVSVASTEIDESSID